jgi:hypothetical protein
LMNASWLMCGPAPSTPQFGLQLKSCRRQKPHKLRTGRAGLESSLVRQWSRTRSWLVSVVGYVGLSDVRLFGALYVDPLPAAFAAQTVNSIGEDMTCRRVLHRNPHKPPDGL